MARGAKSGKAARRDEREKRIDACGEMLHRCTELRSDGTLISGSKSIRRWSISMNPAKRTRQPTARCIQLARRRIEELGKQCEQQHKETLTSVKNSLDRADEMAKSEPQRAAKIRNAVIKLYSDKAWAKEAVRRARAESEGH